MKFLPLTEDQIESRSIAPEGIYNYRVIKSEEKIGKDSGNEYIALVLEIWTENSPIYTIFSNLSMNKLIKHFCDVNNLQDAYNSGTLLANQCLGRGEGCVIIDIDEAKPNGKGGMYPKKNIVKDYISSPPGSLTRPFGQQNISDTEDIPF